MGKLRNVNSEEEWLEIEDNSKKRIDLRKIELAINSLRVLGVISRTDDLTVICSGILRMEKISDNSQLLNMLKLKRPITMEAAIEVRKKIQLLIR